MPSAMRRASSGRSGTVTVEPSASTTSTGSTNVSWQRRAGHPAYDDPEWSADAAWVSLTNEYGLRATYTDPNRSSTSDRCEVQVDTPAACWPDLAAPPRRPPAGLLNLDRSATLIRPHLTVDGERLAARAPSSGLNRPCLTSSPRQLCPARPAPRGAESASASPSGVGRSGTLQSCPGSHGLSPRSA